MTAEYVSEIPRTVRVGDALCTVLGASAATLFILAFHARPLLLCGLLLAQCGLLLWRWHRAEHWAALVLGATMGNITEVACDLRGIWIHRTQQLFDSVPLFILLCYPILALALPPLIDAALGRRRPARECEPAALPWALGLWGLHLALSLRFGLDNHAQLVMCALCLGATLLRFRSPHDLGFAGVGAVLALVWELPCTALGAWRFAAPELGGLIPLWLPLAYAVFFINLGRVIAVCGRLAARRSRRQG